MSPKMTLNDVANEFRKRGISIDNKVLSDGIVDGTYPIGRLVSESSTGRRRFEIWRKDVLAFLADITGETPLAAAAPAQNPAVFPAPISAKAAQVIKWATVCSSPRHQESDCMECPYRTMGLCSDALLADAASVLMDMTLGTICA